MPQSKSMIHAETITQNVVGLIIGFAILNLYGLSVKQSLSLQFTMFFTSYLRSYTIRSIFSRWS